MKAINGKLMISVSNCDGLHSHDESWNPSQAEKIFALSKEYGMPTEAVEKLMGDTVYDSGESLREGAHVYAHFRKDGFAHLVINNCWTETTTVKLSGKATVYALPALGGVTVPTGTLEIAPGSCTFIVL